MNAEFAYLKRVDAVNEVFQIKNYRLINYFESMFSSFTFTTNVPFDYAQGAESNCGH